MRTAIFSDIHGNYEALQVVLDDIEQRVIDRVLCLGDLVEGGEDNERVVAKIRELNIPTVQGNHDEHNDCRLPEDIQYWLDELPLDRIEGDCIYTHITSKSKKRIISNNIEAWNVFDETNYRLCFIGHTHFPALFGDRNEAIGEARAYSVDGGEFKLDENDRYIISFGAVDYARRGGNYIRYGIYDDQALSVTFIKLNGPLLPL